MGWVEEVSYLSESVREAGERLGQLVLDHHAGSQTDGLEAARREMRVGPRLQPGEVLGLSSTYCASTWLAAMMIMKNMYGNE